MAALFLTLPLLGGVAAAVPHQEANPASETATTESRAIALATLMRTECEQIWRTSSVEDLEAALAYRLSQSGEAESEDVVKPAFRLLAKTEALPERCRLAVANLRLAALGEGTGAIGGFGAGSSSFGPGGSFFSPPLVTIGGGSSNYSS